jgi:hypothetical protein
MSSFCTSLISSLVTSHGPTGPKVTLRDVVANAVARDDVERVLLRQVLAGRADHDRDFALVVELGRALRDHGVVVRADDAVRRLLKDDRLLRDLRAGLGRMVGVVEADRDEMARVADAGAKPGASLHGRQLGKVSLGDLLEAGRRERVARDVGHDLGEIADLAVLVDDAGLFAAGRAEADELHVSPFKSCQELLVLRGVPTMRRRSARRKALRASISPRCGSVGKLRALRDRQVGPNVAILRGRIRKGEP